MSAAVFDTFPIFSQYLCMLYAFYHVMRNQVKLIFTSVIIIWLINIKLLFEMNLILYRFVSISIWEAEKLIISLTLLEI